MASKTAGQGKALRLAARHLNTSQEALQEALLLLCGGAEPFLKNVMKEYNLSIEEALRLCISTARKELCRGEFSILRLWPGKGNRSNGHKSNGHHHHH